MDWQQLGILLIRLHDPIDRVEAHFLKMKNISTIANQIIFLMLADRVFLVGPKITCLYTLMFYNVFTYCVNYIKELIEKENWTPYVTLTETSKIKHLAMSATKIVFEWTKAITFLVTLTFMLLVFGLEQGLKHYKPTTIYTIVTWIYYASTEKIFADMVPSALKLFHMKIFENLEEFYVPVILKSFDIGTSALCIVILVTVVSWKFLLIAAYLNVYLESKNLLQKCLPALQHELEILRDYRKATPEEIKQFDDVCPVCLCNMINARITPCYHLFHADCLRLCLQKSDTCPMCKREFKVISANGSNNVS